MFRPLLILFLLVSVLTHAQTTYDFDEPIGAIVVGRPFLEDGLGTHSKRVYGIKRGDTVNIVGTVKLTGNYLVDFKDCYRCVLKRYFVETDKEMENSIAKSIEKAKQVEEVVIRKKDSIHSLKLKNEALEYRGRCQYSKNEVDEFNGKILRYTEKYCLEQEAGSNIGQFCVQLRRVGTNDYAIFEHFMDLGCASSYKFNKSVVQVKLDNGDIVKFFHSGQTDCGSFRLVGKLTESDKARLKKSPISIIRLEGTESYLDIEDIVYKEVFIDKIDCLD